MGDDDALTGGQSVGLDHERGLEERQRRLNVVHVDADGVMRRGYVVPLHEFFGEALAALKLCGSFGGPKDAQAALLEGIHDAEIERDFGSDDGQVHAEFLGEGDFKWSSDATACVVIASGGYPDAYEGGKPVTGLKEASQVEGVKIFHAGTSKRNNEYITSGGRVLGVTARAKDLGVALDRAYQAAAKLKFDGMYYRKDIGARALVKK